MIDDKEKAFTCSTLNNEAIVECYDARGNGDGQTASNLTGDHENRVTDYTNVVCLGSGQPCQITGSEIANALDCMHDKQSIVYPEKTGALSCGAHPGGLNGQDALTMAPVIKVDKPKRKYIIRRLTPTECQRLQGFPDGWGVPDHKDDMTEDEVAFWNQVRKTHAEVNGKQYKPMTKEQTIRWYNKLHTDSAEYKMWGNGIALPCAAYVLGGIAEEATP